MDCQLSTVRRRRGDQEIAPTQSVVAIGTGGTASFLMNVTCDLFPKAADRSLAIVVSDRAFVDLPDSTDENRLSYYRDDAGHVTQTFVVGTWRIAGCP